jgi:hypothetical protein
LLTLGRVYVEPLADPSRQFNWLGYRRDEGGRVAVEGTAAGLVGLVIITIVISVLVGLVKFS